MPEEEQKNSQRLKSVRSCKIELFECNIWLWKSLVSLQSWSFMVLLYTPYLTISYNCQGRDSMPVWLWVWSVKVLSVAARLCPLLLYSPVLPGNFCYQQKLWTCLHSASPDLPAYFNTFSSILVWVRIHLFLFSVFHTPWYLLSVPSVCPLKDSPDSQLGFLRIGYNRLHLRYFSLLLQRLVNPHHNLGF